ncbi:hypothetical protein [Methylocystis sp.]|uniref:hypothetical protein n=1 Tax=Methylocystis sp. TaxID=1911079 RepID=UPI0025E27A60|nr:hypothetical protein [Methylocystis sp.]
MRAEICTKQARFTLERLHAELGGKIIENKKEAERLAADMKHVEAVLKMLDPSYCVRSIAVRRRKPNPYFKRGTIFRSVLEILRDAPTPLTASEITSRLLASKDVSQPSREDFRNLFGGVQASLRNNDGKTVRAIGEGKPARWELMP